MQLSVSMCVIGLLICNQNDKLNVILMILFLQCTRAHPDIWKWRWKFFWSRFTRKDCRYTPLCTAFGSGWTTLK